MPHVCPIGVARRDCDETSPSSLPGARCARHRASIVVEDRKLAERYSEPRVLGAGSRTPAPETRVAYFLASLPSRKYMMEPIAMPTRQSVTTNGTNDSIEALIPSDRLEVARIREMVSHPLPGRETGAP